MSISMKFVPYALALKNLTGKQNYEDWVRSMDRPCSTYIADETELQFILERAGLDYVRYGSIRKTHMGNNYFIWRFQEQTWQAVFSAYDNPAQVDVIMQQLEASYGKPLWKQERQIQTARSFLTDFTDVEILKQSLLHCQLNVQETSQGDLLCEDNHVLFHRLEDGCFTLMSSQPNLDQIFDVFSQVDTIYKQYVQDKTYQSILQRVKSNPTFRFVEESVEENNTIVLTVEVLESF